VESAAAVDHVEGNPTEPIDTDEIVNAVQQVAEQAGEDVKEGALKGLQAQSSVAEDGDAKHPSMTLEEALLPQVQQVSRHHFSYLPTQTLTTLNNRSCLRLSQILNLHLRFRPW